MNLTEKWLIVNLGSEVHKMSLKLNIPDSKDTKTTRVASKELIGGP